MFQKKVKPVVTQSKFAPKQTAPKGKKGWGGVVKKKEVTKREPFVREYTRDVKFANGDVSTYVWVFKEYKHPCSEAPQMRLMEEKFIMDGRNRIKMHACPVVWMVDIEVRIEAYMEYQRVVEAIKNESL